jgi:hypothetical protein
VLYGYVELTKGDKEIILKQAKATHDEIEWDSGEIKIIETLEIKMPEKIVCKERKRWALNKAQIPYSQTIPDTIWGRIRKSLITLHTEASDRHWFSKLEAEVNEERREIYLKAPSEFIKDYICGRYLFSIERLSEMEEYRVIFV